MYRREHQELNEISTLIPDIGNALYRPLNLWAIVVFGDWLLWTFGTQLSKMHCLYNRLSALEKKCSLSQIVVALVTFQT